MFRVAIVDDDIVFCSKLQNYIEIVWGTNNFADDFCNGREFIEALDKGNKYDIVFLDIEMPFINGFEAGSTLRALDKDENVYIVYVSSYTERLTQLFALHPFDFLTKPVDFDTFKNVWNKIITDINLHKKRIEITYKREHILIPISDITYIEALSRRIIIHTVDGNSIESYEQISSIYGRIILENSFFIRPHKSYIVNRQYIDRYDKSSITIGNISIPIGRSYRQNIYSDLFDYSMMKGTEDNDD